MLIVCGGLYRSGSNRQYDTVRFLLPESDTTAFELPRSDIENEKLIREKIKSNQHCIIKTHRFSQVLANKADVILTCHRDVRSILASRVRVLDRIKIANKEGRRFLQSMIDDKQLENYMQWSCLATLDQKYEEVMDNKESKISAIFCVSHSMQIQISKLEAEAVLIKLEDPNSRAFPLNLSKSKLERHKKRHKRRRNKEGKIHYWKELFDEKFIEIVNQKLRWYQKWRKYF